MTFFSRCAAPQEIVRRPAGRGRGSSASRRPRALAEFLEEIGILLRYATGRDYYDRGGRVAKD